MPYVSPSFMPLDTGRVEDRRWDWPGGAKSVRWSVIFIYLLLAIYMTCHGMLSPVLPYLWTQLHGGNLGYGLLLTEFGAFQAVGCILAGPLLDRFGGRLWLAESFVAAGAMLSLTAFAKHLWVLYLSRVLACVEVAFLSTKVLVTERSSDQDRARYLGYVGGCAGIGAVVGPYIGGLVSSVSLRLCAWIAAIAAVSCSPLVLFIPAARQGDYKAVTEEVELPRAASYDADPEDMSPPIKSANSLGAEAGESLPAASPLQHAPSAGLLGEGGMRRKKSLPMQAAKSVGAPISRQGSPLRGDGAMTRRKSLKHHRASDESNRSGSGLPPVSQIKQDLAASLQQAGEEGSWQLPTPSICVEAPQEHSPGLASSSPLHIIQTCREPGVPSLLFIKILMALGYSLIASMLPLLLQKHYQLTPKENGMVLSYSGMVVVAVEMLAVGPISSRLSVHMAGRLRGRLLQVVLSCGWGAVASFAGFALSFSSVWALMAVLPCLMLCGLVVQTICSAQLTKIVPGSSRGKVLALDSAQYAIVGVISPQIGALVYELLGFSAIGVSGSVTALAMVCLVHLGCLQC